MAGNIFFMGDAHLSHPKVNEDARKMPSEREYQEMLAHNINATVKKRDVLYWTGDICLGSMTTLEKFMSKLTLGITHKLVLGNHDHMKNQFYENLFSKVRSVFEIQRAIETGTTPRTIMAKYVVTHIPVHESCLSRWSVNIHAHTHTHIIPDPRYVSTSLDVNDFRPVSLDSIVARTQDMILESRLSGQRLSTN